MIRFDHFLTQLLRTPAVPEGSSSDWHIAEWHTGQVMDPSLMSVGDSSMADPMLGVTDYSWATANGNIRFAVSGQPGNFT